MADIMALLKDRLAQTTAERATIQAEFLGYESALSSLLAKLPKGFKGSRAEYDGIDEKVRDQNNNK